MRKNIRIKANINPNDEGSSLAIALFFFLLCSLICAGIIYLANTSSIGSASKSLASLQQDPFPYDPDSIPVPSITPTDTPAYDPDAEAVAAVCSIFKQVYGEAFVAAESGEETKIFKGPENIPYEILSYLHFYYGWAEAPVLDGNLEPKTFQVTLQGRPTVNVIVEMTGTEGSVRDGRLSAKTGLEFKTIKITVVSVNNPSCQEIFEYAVPGEGKCYIRLIYVTKQPYQTYFVIKNTP